LRFLLAIIACIAAAYALCLYLTIPANPEIHFWHSVKQQRERELATVRQQQPKQPVILFTGGSSCAFSIDPRIIEETCAMPAFNLGLPVSTGPKYLLHQALEQARAGDVLVVCMEADVLTYPSDYAPTTLTFGMAVMDGDPSATVGGSSFGNHLEPREYLNYSRPGPGYMTTWLARKISGKGYRYTNDDFRYRGRLETSVRDPKLQPAGAKHVTQVHPDAADLLLAFEKSAKRKGVQLTYSMPWILTHKDHAAHNRNANLGILASINTVIPTIDDGFQGVSTDSADFADSGLHLSAAGSARRSKALAEALRGLLKRR
jgi:hypothetical protein